MNTVQVTIDGESKFDSDKVSGCTIERMYDGWGYTTTITIHHGDEPMVAEQ